MLKIGGLWRIARFQELWIHVITYCKAMSLRVFWGGKCLHRTSSIRARASKRTLCSRCESSPYFQTPITCRSLSHLPQSVAALTPSSSLVSSSRPTPRTVQSPSTLLEEPMSARRYWRIRTGIVVSNPRQGAKKTISISHPRSSFSIESIGSLPPRSFQNTTMPTRKAKNQSLLVIHHAWSWRVLLHLRFTRRTHWRWANRARFRYHHVVQGARTPRLRQMKT